VSDGEIPAWDAKSPVPCTQEMLCAWLAKHHEFAFQPEGLPRMETIVAAVDHRYGGTVPSSRGEPVPAIWDVWKFVADHKKRIRGGQRSSSRKVGYEYGEASAGRALVAGRRRGPIR
jgi:hypothetical protein